MKQIIKLIALFAISFGIVWYAKDHVKILGKNRVDAAGALSFNLGVPNGTPIFNFSNIAPGDEYTHDVTANNADTLTRTVGVKGIKTGGAGSLEDAMEIIIREKNGADIYGGSTGVKTLSDFFADSQSINGITLSNVAPSASKIYTFFVRFIEESGNEYQNNSVDFDLRFGIVTDIPESCSRMRFTRTIYGTSGNDRLRGTSGQDLIIAMEGNDTVNGASGNDCIVGGDGNDTINGGSGNDVLAGEAGNDTLRGESGNDRLIGGEGNLDAANGGSGSDRCEAETKSQCEL